MSEGEVTQLRRDIAALSAKADKQYEASQKQHEANQQDREVDRRVFQQAIELQKNAMQEAINKQFLEYVALDKKVESGNILLKLAVGTGQAGEGRVGALEKAVETLQKFRWQTLAIIALLLLLAEHAKDFIGK